MTDAAALSAIAVRLMAAHDAAAMLAPITAEAPDFSVTDAYGVLGEIAVRRRAQGWQAVGRKIGFTNRTIWPRYGVDRPMWAPVWAHTLHHAPDGEAALSLRLFVQPRIEPEVVFRLKAPPPPDADAATVLEGVEWMAPGFEVVQSPFPDWKFAAPDCTAAWGLHGALVVGPPLPVTEANRAELAARLSTFTATLARDGRVVDRGQGSNVLGSPALALADLARLLASQPQFAPLAPGEIVTTGTLTDAWPVTRGELWSSDYGDLGLTGLTLRFV